MGDEEHDGVECDHADTGSCSPHIDEEQDGECDLADAGDHEDTGGAEDNNSDIGIDEEVRERILFLNSEGGFDDQILLDDVEDSAGEAPKADIMKILDDLCVRNQSSQLENPTAWII